MNVLPLVSAQQSKALDQLTELQYNISGQRLMDNAGRLAAENFIADFKPQNKQIITVLCGPGNNGGDGKVMASYLQKSGYQVNTDVSNLEKSDYIVDALFGVGLSKPIEGHYKSLIESANALKKPIISLDVPSGLDCNRGVVLETAICAQKTYTFGLSKPGFYIHQGPQHCGEIKVLDIGFPPEACKTIAKTYFLFEKNALKGLVKKHSQLINKTSRGGVLVAAGQQGMWGAGVLACKAAYRMGAGYVFWGSFDSNQHESPQVPEALLMDLNNHELFANPKIHAFAVGPGLGVNEQTAEWLKLLKSKTDKPVVLDADAITTCVNHNLFPLPEHWVLTPHAGELSRILKCTAQEVEENRFTSLQHAAEITGCNILLKGFHSILIYREQFFIINSGNNALAKAGTGDVLTGMVGSLLAQGVLPYEAAAAASYVHGSLADQWLLNGKSPDSMMASDLIEALAIYSLT